MRMLTLKTAGVTLAAAAAIAIVGASAARADEVVITNLKVPFAFIVGDVRLPAGDYSVREASTGLDVVKIVSVDGRHSALVATVPSAPDPADKNEVVFEKVGEEHFLSRIEPSDGNDRQIILTPSIMEREIVKAGRAAN
jgi:hypothetical protein